MGLFDWLSGKKKAKTPRQTKVRGPSKPKTLESEIVTYVRQLKRNDPATYDLYMRGLAAKRLGIGGDDAKKSDLENYIDMKVKLKKAGLEGDSGDGGSSPAAMFHDLLDTQAGAALGNALAGIVAPMVTGGRSAPRAQVPAVIDQIPAAAVMPSTQPQQPTDEETMAMIDKFKSALDGKSPAEAAGLLKMASGFDALAKAIQDDMLRIGGDPDSVATYIAQRRASDPQFAPLMDWLGSAERFDWLVSVVAEVKKLHGAGQTGSAPAKAAKRAPF